MENPHKMPETSNLHDELSTALKLFDITLKDWATKLVKPTGGVGVSSTAVIRCAKGQENIEWISKEIHKLITQARNTFPEYYKYHSSEVV